MAYITCHFNTVFHSSWETLDLIILTPPFRYSFQISYTNKEERFIGRQHHAAKSTAKQSIYQYIDTTF